MVSKQLALAGVFHFITICLEDLKTPKKVNEDFASELLDECLAFPQRVCTNCTGSIAFLGKVAGLTAICDLLKLVLMDVGYREVVLTGLCTKQRL